MGNVYGKIFDSLWKGSMRGKRDLQLVFIHMICNCDQDGNCDYLPQVICDDTGMSLPDVLNAISELQSPDPLSRTPDEQGRRIVPLSPGRPWGWRIVNHLVYRERLSSVWKKEQNAERQRRYYLKHKPNAKTVRHDAPSVSVSVSDSSLQGESREGFTLEACLAAIHGTSVTAKEAEHFFHYYEGKGLWHTVKSLKHALQSWKMTGESFQTGKSTTGSKPRHEPSGSMNPDDYTGGQKHANS
jgi:hypothetical protein